MSKPEILTKSQLLWPKGRPRTSAQDRKAALFRQEGSPLTFDRARRRLLETVYMITRNGQNWRVLEMVLTTNIRVTQSGARDRNFSQREPDDVGVAFYFELDGKPHVLACDRWDTVAGNIGAIDAHIEALRGQERWGVADLRQAFAGHVALPPPDPWWAVLGVPRACSLADAAAAFRRLSKSAHPDAGGQRAEWDRLNAAYDAAKQELGRA